MTSAVEVAAIEDRLNRTIEKVAADIAATAQRQDERTRIVEDRLTRIEVAREAEDRAGSSVSFVNADRYEEHRLARLKWQDSVDADLRALRRFMYLAGGGLTVLQLGLKFLA